MRVEGGSSGRARASDFGSPRSRSRGRRLPKASRAAFPAAILAAIFAAILAAALPAGASAQTGPFEADPGFAELGAVADPLPREDLVRAAFLASGTALDLLPGYAARLEALLAGLESRLGGIEGHAERGAALLEALHDGTLVKYEENATTLDGLLDTGRYNCVSSAMLYMIAGERLGLAIGGVRTFDHAFCSLSVPASGNKAARSIDIETTNRYGFEPGARKEFTDSFGRVTGYNYVPPGKYSKRFPVDARGMAGLILSNRAAAYERSKRFDEALRMAVDRMAMRADADSVAFFADCVGNLAAELSAKRDFEGAEALARAAASIANTAYATPQPRLTSLVRTTSYNSAVGLSQAGKREEAFEAAAALAAAYPNDPSFATLAERALSALGEAAAKAKDFEGARKAIEERSGRAGPTRSSALKATRAALKLVDELELADAVASPLFEAAAEKAAAIGGAGRVDQTVFGRAIAAIYGAEASRIAKEGDWLAAAAVADRGKAVAAGDGTLARLAKTMRRNFSAEAHNRFAAFYNAGQYELARASIEESLKALPDDATMLADLALAKKAQSR